MSKQKTKTKKARHVVYAVRVGRVPGVYADKEIAMQQVYRFKGSELRKFNKNATKSIQTYMQTGIAKKTKNQKRAEAEKKSHVFVVRVGRKTGIFKTKEEALQQTQGYPHGQYKEFRASQKKQIKDYLKKAPKYLKHEENNIIDILNDDNDKLCSSTTCDEYPAEAHNAVCVAYVDGSYFPNTNRGGAGIVLFYQGKRKEISIEYPDTEILAQYANLPCELFAVQMALYTAELHGAKHIILYHDMEACAKYANDEYPANTTLTQAYRNIILLHRLNMRIEFRQILGHTGNIHHNRADKLAAKAVRQ